MYNPFTLAFGKKPLRYISRLMYTNKVIDSFTAEVPSAQVYMITGVRGSGKTVFMTNIVSEMREKKDWYAIELNTDGDLLSDLASKLYSIPGLNALFLKAKIDLSFFGLGVSIESSVPITNIESAIDRMLKVLKKNDKHLLIALDEVVSNKEIRRFANAFQIFVRQDYDIYMLMTGLYENIFNLQNEDTLTFLYRAPKIMLEPLNISAIAASYKEVFDIDEEEAMRMAVLTRGYAFAYQVLGYIRWEHKNRSIEDIMPEYDQYLQEYVYDKIWHELSDRDREVLHVLSGSESMRVKDILKELNVNSSQFSTYRDRLIKKGLIDTSRYGYMSIILPRFSDYIKIRMF